MKKQWYGCLCALIYVMLSAAQSVYAGNITQHFSPSALSVFCFMIVTVTTMSMGLVNKKISLRILQDNARTFFMANITTAGLWLGFFISVKYIEPALAVIIFGVVGPAMIALLAPFIRPQSVILNSEKYSSLLYLAIFIGIVFVIIDHKAAIASHTLLYSIIGMVSALIASLAT